MILSERMRKKVESGEVPLGTVKIKYLTGRNVPVKERVELGLCKACGRKRGESKYKKLCTPCAWEARLRKENGLVFFEHVLEMWRIQEFACVYCRGALCLDEPGSVHLDHIYAARPSNKRHYPGSDFVANRQLLCHICNSAKKNLHERDFIRWVERLVESFHHHNGFPGKRMYAGALAFGQELDLKLEEREKRHGGAPDGGYILTDEMQGHAAESAKAATRSLFDLAKRWMATSG